MPMGSRGSPRAGTGPGPLQDARTSRIGPAHELRPRRRSRGAARVMITILKRLVGSARGTGARNLAQRLPRPDAAGRDVQRELLLRPDRSGTPTASSAATITSARSARRRTFAAGCPIGGYDRHEPYIDRVRQGDTCALRPGDRGADVRHDLGHDQAGPRRFP